MELKEFIKRLSSIVIFGIVYMSTFFVLEQRDVPIHIIHTALDDIIPFCEYFIVPYVIWYAYVVGTILYLGLTDKSAKEYYGLIWSMMLGMVVFVLVCLIYPNGQNLRPTALPDNVFGQAVAYLYTIDTSTNILPSLHVFVSVACDIALCRDPRFKKHPTWIWASHILTISICLATMFLKQHSAIDVITALICNLAIYLFVYHSKFITAKFAK